LVILARGISRRLRAAYSLTLILLMLGIVSSYFKGLDHDEAIALSAVFLVLFPTKREFYRQGSLFSQGFTVEWMSVLTALLAFVVWLGLFNYRFTPYHPDLWWTFAYDADVARCLRSTFVVFLITGAVTLLNLVRPDPVPMLAQADELKRVRRIIKNEPDTRANLALLGDKRLLFSESGSAFLMYQVQGKSWVALGEPIGPFKEHARILLSYRELCDRHGGWPVFYLIDAQHLSHYVDLGLSILKLGDEARISLSDFSVLSVTSAAIRDVHREVRAQGVRLEILNSSQIAPVLPELAAVSQAWLAGHDMREQGFSKGFFDPAYISQFPCAVARKENQMVAFAVLWASPNKEELALDLMRFHPEAPKGVIDFLLVELILGGKARGYRWFNLGVSPLPGMQDHPLAPVWQRIGKLMYRQGEHFQNIESLRRYEENFNPVWRPKYLASPGGVNLPRILRDVAKLNARGRMT
jgi:phosphatidylglycerol lysyltransferase